MGRLSNCFSVLVKSETMLTPRSLACFVTFNDIQSTNQVCTHWNCIINSIETGAYFHLKCFSCWLQRLTDFYVFLPDIEQSTCNVLRPTTEDRPALVHTLVYLIWTCSATVWGLHVLPWSACVLSRFSWSWTGYSKLFLGVNVSLYLKIKDLVSTTKGDERSDKMSIRKLLVLKCHWYSGESGSQYVLEKEKKKITCTWLHK